MGLAFSAGVSTHGPREGFDSQRELLPWAFRYEETVLT